MQRRGRNSERLDEHPSHSRSARISRSGPTRSVASPVGNSAQRSRATAVGATHSGSALRLASCTSAPMSSRRFVLRRCCVRKSASSAGPSPAPGSVVIRAPPSSPGLSKRYREDRQPYVCLPCLLRERSPSRQCSQHAFTWPAAGANICSVVRRSPDESAVAVDRRAARITVWPTAARTDARRGRTRCRRSRTATPRRRSRAAPRRWRVS